MHQLHQWRLHKLKFKFLAKPLQRETQTPLTKKLLCESKAIISITKLICNRWLWRRQRDVPVFVLYSRLLARDRRIPTKLHVYVTTSGFTTAVSESVLFDFRYETPTYINIWPIGAAWVSRSLTSNKITACFAWPNSAARTVIILCWVTQAK